MDQWISLLCDAYAAAGCALSSSHPTVQAFCFLCGAYAAVGCALSSSHPTTQAFRFPCSACAAVGCALPCCIRLPKTFVALQCMIFFSIGLLVLIGLCFFYRLETSAPGLSGYYWYSVGLVEGTASCFDLWIKITQFWKSSLSPILMSGHAALSRSKVRSKSLWPSFTCSIPCHTKRISDYFFFRYFAGGWCLSFTCTKPWKGASVNFLHRDFPCSMPALQNRTHQREAPFTSQGSQDLVKLLPHWGSFTFRP